MNDLKTKSPKKNDRVLRELETTFDLLQATMPSIKSPEMEKSPIPSLNQPTPSRQNSASPYVSSSEDEVYFGPVTEKERYGNSARYPLINKDSRIVLVDHIKAADCNLALEFLYHIGMYSVGQKQKAVVEKL